MRRIQPATTALIVVDVQNDFCHPDGAFGSRGTDVSAVQRMVVRLQAFIHAPKGAGVKVIYIQTTHDETTDSEAWATRNGDRPQVQTCRPGAWGTDFYGIEPDPKDVVVIKHRYSALVG